MGGGQKQELTSSFWLWSEEVGEMGAKVSLKLKLWPQGWMWRGTVCESVYSNIWCSSFFSDNGNVGGEDSKEAQFCMFMWCVNVCTFVMLQRVDLFKRSEEKIN